jgi:hypothetical protein
MFKKPETQMGTGRTLNKKPRTRPVKSEGDRHRRMKTQGKLLIALGADAGKGAKLNASEVRTALKRPAKVKAAAAKKAVAAV